MQKENTSETKEILGKEKKMEIQVEEKRRSREKKKDRRKKKRKE